MLKNTRKPQHVGDDDNINYYNYTIVINVLVNYKITNLENDDNNNIYINMCFNLKTNSMIIIHTIYFTNKEYIYIHI